MQRRRSYVKHILFYAILPEYDVSLPEMPEDRLENNKAYTLAIKSLFETLSLWPDSDNCEVLLELRAQSPSDWDAEPDELKRRRRLKSVISGNTGDLLNIRWADSFLDIDGEAENLCLAPVIKHLDLRPGGSVTDLDQTPGEHRMLSQATHSKIISRLPQLRSVVMYPDDDERDDHAQRNSLREEFALSLSTWPSSLRSLTMEYPGEPPENQNFPPLVRSVPGKDALSLALNVLSQQLESIKLTMMMTCPEILWPQSKTTQPYWPRLTQFHLSYTVATPSGQWLFERDPRWRDRTPDKITSDEGNSDVSENYSEDDLSDHSSDHTSDDSEDGSSDNASDDASDNSSDDASDDSLNALLDYFRDDPGDEGLDDESHEIADGFLPPQDADPNLFRTKPLDILNKLYLAAGRAARQMPQLKLMKLEACIDFDEGLNHVITRGDPSTASDIIDQVGWRAGLAHLNFTSQKKYARFGTQLRKVTVIVR
ncbi:hypothetical protein N7454_005967 [Penicillium verhagenii]|nr:hypothetical protein N7454_005967 [Penicillium verhagenii]